MSGNVGLWLIVVILERKMVKREGKRLLNENYRSVTYRVSPKRVKADVFGH